MSWRRGAIGLLLSALILSSCGRVDHVFFAAHRRQRGAELLFSSCNADRPPAISEVRVTVLRKRRRVLLWRIVAASGRPTRLSSAIVGQAPTGFVERAAVAGRPYGPWIGVEARTRSAKLEPAGPVDVRLPYDHRRVRTSGGVMIRQRLFPAWAKARCDHRPSWLGLVVIIGLLALPAGTAVAGGLFVRAARRRRPGAAPDVPGGEPVPGAPVQPPHPHPPPLPPAV